MTDNQSSGGTPPPQPQEENPYLASSAPPEMPSNGHVIVNAGGVTPDEKTMGMLIHLLAILTGFIGVLILWLVKKDSSKFVDFHGRESLNFMISILIYTVALSILSVVVVFVTAGLGMILMFPLMFVVGIGALVCEILACIAANRGEWHQYPFTLRLIPNVR